MRPPLPAISLENVSGDPDAVRAAFERAGPYRPVQRYFSSAAELSAVELKRGSGSESGPGNGDSQTIRPWFRRDVRDSAELPGAIAELWRSPQLAAAARAVLGVARAEPVGLYLNVVLPSRGVDAGHYDIPRFFGLDRSNCPVWLLAVMLGSGLFESSYRPAATAVIWYYRGPGGAFESWPAGRAAPALRRPARDDGALVSDNDRTLHRICSVDPAAPLELWELSERASLELAGPRWVLRDGARSLDGPREQARLSLALKFCDPAAEGEVLDLEQVRLRLRADLSERGEELRLEPGFERDPACVERLRALYLPT